MKRLFLLGIVILLAVSGCSFNGQPSAGGPQAAQSAAQAAAGSPAGADVSADSAQAAPAPDAAKPTPDAAKPAPATSGQATAEPEAAKPAAQPAEASPAASQAEPAPAAAVQPPAAATAPAEPAQQTPASAENPEKTALTISIIGDKQRGVILKETSMPFQEGMTVLDALKQAARENKLQLEYKGKGAYAYVQGIDNLYEFDGGPKSGWVYKVNGRAPGEGAGSCKVAAGDKIEWLYTLNLGEDVGAKMK